MASSSSSLTSAHLIQAFGGDKLMSEMGRLKMKILMKDGTFKSLPIGLTPVSIPRQKMRQLIVMQMEILDHLIYAISQHKSILIDLLSPTAENDAYIRKWLDILRKAVDSGIYERKPYISVVRSDFFYDELTRFWKLIEINTISVAGGFFCDQIDQLYRNCGLHSKLSLCGEGNRSTSIADALAAVHKLYLDTFSESEQLNLSVKSESGATIMSNNAAEGEGSKEENNNLNNGDGSGGENGTAMVGCGIMIIVRNYKESFQMDQLSIASFLIQKNIPVVLSTLEDAVSCGYEVNEQSRLVAKIRDQHHHFLNISCLYFRGGYDPSDYVNEQCWKFVCDAELSKTVLLPSVGLHLAGTKSVQCALAENEGQLIKDLMPNNQHIPLLRSTFVAQFELDESNLKHVIENNDKYVVKPQREGGTNNLFGQDIVQLGQNMESEKDSLSRFIAMELIKGETLPQYPVRMREGKVEIIKEAVAEIGATSVLLMDKKDGQDQVVQHQFSGFITKIKSKDSNEAGVSVGHGFLTTMSCDQ